MTNWFEVSAKYLKEVDGAEKRVTEKYMVDAVNCTDAEACVVNYLDGEKEVDVKSVAAKEIADVVRSGHEDCRWYRVKTMYLELDEKTGRDKRVPSTVMVQARSVEHAVKEHERFMHGTVSDWELHSVVETAIVEVLDPATVEETRHGKDNG